MTDDRCELLCIDFDHAESLRVAMPAGGVLGRLADRLRAIGDPTRLRVAHTLLVGDELCVCDLAWVVGASQGLVSSRRDGKLVMYRLTDLGRQLLTTVGELETKAGA